jgi:hypothetical protein
MPYGGDEFELPKDHKAFLKGVREFSCANCKYLKPGRECGNEHFQKWNGSAKLPAGDLTEMCSDWFEEGEQKKRTLGDHLRDQKKEK